jgi:hypothetical protein
LDILGKTLLASALLSLACAGGASGSTILSDPDEGRLELEVSAPYGEETFTVTQNTSDIQNHSGSRVSRGYGMGMMAMLMVIAPPEPDPVPEPGTWALMAGGMGLLALRRWRGRRAQAGLI